MFTLQLDKSKFYKVKQGQNALDISSTLLVPTNEVFAGKIIVVEDGFTYYSVKPLESYFDIAKKFSVSEERLRKSNFDKILYPTAKILIPPK